MDCENSPLAVLGRRKRSVDYRTDDDEAKMALLPSAWPTVDEVFHVTEPTPRLLEASSDVGLRELPPLSEVRSRLLQPRRTIQHR